MKIKMIKKSMDVPKDLHGRVKAVVDMNPGMTFTQATIEALENWLKDPKITVKLPGKDSGENRRGATK